MMDKPVEERGRHDLVAEELCPGVEGLIAGYDDGCPLVEVGDEGKEEIRFVALDRCIADLVDDHEVRLCEPRESELGAPGDVGAREDLHEVRHALVADLEALVDGFVADGDGQVGFSEARRAEEEEILMAIDPTALGELVDHALRDTLHPAEIEVLEAFLDREMSHGEVPPETALTPVPDLAVDELIEEGLVGKASALCPREDGLEIGCGTLETQALELPGGFRDAVHASPPSHLPASSMARW